MDIGEIKMFYPVLMFYSILWDSSIRIVNILVPGSEVLHNSCVMKISISNLNKVFCCSSKEQHYFKIVVEMEGRKGCTKYIYYSIFILIVLEGLY